MRRGGGGGGGGEQQDTSQITHGNYMIQLESVSFTELIQCEAKMY